MWLAVAAGVMGASADAAAVRVGTASTVPVYRVFELELHNTKTTVANKFGESFFLLLSLGSPAEIPLRSPLPRCLLGIAAEPSFG